MHTATVVYSVIEWPLDLQVAIEDAYMEMPTIPLVSPMGRRELTVLDAIGIALMAWYSDDITKETAEFFCQHHGEREEAFAYYVTETDILVNWILSLGEPFFNMLTPRQYYPKIITCDRLMVYHYGQ